MTTNPTAQRQTFQGNDSALLGIVLAVITFWLFAQTTMNIGPLMAQDVGMRMEVMNIAISLSALFSAMALLKVYWDGPARQRAVSMWSIGSWGGSGLTAVFGGFMASTVLGWRSIFVICALISVASILLMRQIPEAAPGTGAKGRTDWLDTRSSTSGCSATRSSPAPPSRTSWSTGPPAR